MNLVSFNSFQGLSNKWYSVRAFHCIVTTVHYLLSICRGNELSQARAFPPERFIAAQLCGGLNVLYKRLGNRKKTCHPKHGRNLLQSITSLASL